MRIALTGTPGVGKTTLAALARQELGWRVIDVKAWARREGAVAGRDGQVDEVDTETLAARVPPDDGSMVIYEGHLSHHLPLDAAWVVRLDPARLRPRLEARGYAPRKVQENLEAEALDIILQEALDAFDAVAQRNGTRRSPKALLKSFVESGSGRFKGKDLEEVDWSHRLPL